MREDEKFEIERAYDLLPHVIGASWACVFFRLNQIKKPTREEFRDKVVEYLNVLEKLGEAYPPEEQFFSIKDYIKNRHGQEVEKILDGKNQEVEKRYERYLDYG
jgi:hypothetical protein